MAPARTKRTRSAPSEAPLRPEKARKTATQEVAQQAVRRPAKAPPGPRLEPLVWLEGQRDDGTWTGLYCTRNEQQAKAWYRLIIERGDDHPDIIKDGLHVYEDFRIKREGDDAAE